MEMTATSGKILIQYRELFLRSARKYDSDIIDGIGDQYWDLLRIHRVELGTHIRQQHAMEKLQVKIKAGPENITLV